MSINALPDEILLRTLLRLPNKARIRCERVCRRWQDILENDCWAHIDDFQYGGKLCHLCDLPVLSEEGELCICGLATSVRSIFSRCSIRKLLIDKSYISKDVIESIKIRADTLVSIKFNRCSFPLVDFAFEVCDFPALEVLEVQSPVSVCSNADHSPSLRRAKIAGQTSEFNQVLTFMKHVKNIQHLWIASRVKWRPSEDEEVCCIFSNQLTDDNLKAPNLRTLLITSELDLCDSCFLKFYKNFPSLKALCVESSRISAETLSSVIQSMPDLESLILFRNRRLDSISFGGFLRELSQQRAAGPNTLNVYVSDFGDVCLLEVTQLLPENNRLQLRRLTHEKVCQEIWTALNATE